MVCNATPFAGGTGCPPIVVDLSFPDIKFCTTPEFQTIEVPELVLNVGVASPDISPPDIQCIDIRPEVSVVWKSNVVISGYTRRNYFTVAASSDNKVAALVASSPQSGEDADCGKGMYKLKLNFEIPCILDSWQTRVDLVNSAGNAVGRLNFTRLSGCRLTGELDLTAACSGGFTIYHCPIDDIDGELKQESTVAGNIRISQVECGYRYLGVIPATSLTYGIHVVIVGTFDGNIDAKNELIAVNSCTGMYFSGIVHLQNPMDIDILGATGINIVHTKSGRINKYVFSGYITRPGSGFTGSRGLRGVDGSDGTMYVGLTGLTGPQGPTGTRGDDGIDKWKTGPRGSRGSSVTCFWSYRYTPTPCEFADASAVLHEVMECEFIIGSEYAYLRVISQNKHFKYVDHGGKHALTSYVSMFSHRYTIAITRLS